MPINPVGTWDDTNYTLMSGTAYPLAVDGNFAVAKRIVDNFAPRPKATPNMTMQVDPGNLWDGANLTEVSVQSTVSITAPVTNPRIDRVVGDNNTGSISVVAGTESVSPTPPAIPPGKFPIAQLLLDITTTAITGAEIADERAFPVPGGAAAWFQISGGVITIQKSRNIDSITYVSTGVFEITFSNADLGLGICVSNTSDGGIWKGPALTVGSTVIAPGNTVTFNVRDENENLFDPSTVKIIVV